MIDMNARGLAVLVMLLIGVLSLTLYSAKAQEEGSVAMYITNPLTGSSSFNVYNYSVNSVFTVEFCVGNVTNLVAWQIRLAYNRTLIQYDAAWFPEDNVFEEAVGRGATPLSEVSNNVNNATEVGDLVLVMISSFSLDNSLQYPVNVTSKGLLCEVNFTVVSHAANTQLGFVSTPTSNTLISPLYLLPNYTTCVETINGTYPADGQPATIYDVAQVPEGSALLLLIPIPATLAVALTRKRTKRSRLCAR
jgi:hypothetical protein